MRRNIVKIMEILKVDAVVAEKVEYIMDCSGIDYSECSMREFRSEAKYAYSRIDYSGAEDIYLAHIDQPYGKRFAETVGRFQEGFLRDKVCRDLDSAFAKAVDAAVRLLPAMQGAK